MRNFALLMVFAVAASLPAWSQTTASLTGTVSDPTGAVVPGAEVALSNPATGFTRTATTGANGSFVFTQLRPGTYRVEVTAQGFKTAVREQVQLLVATATKLDIGLEVGAVIEQVSVEAAVTPTLNTLDASVGAAFSELQVKGLPVRARNPLAILTLQPGVVVAGGSDLDKLFMGTTEGLDERDGVVNGVRANQSNITLDGVDVNDAESQAAFLSVLPVSLDSLQEFRVITTNATATEGTAGGAQVAMVTKSGSNEWHGNAREFHRNDATSANLFFNNKSDLPVPKLIRNIFGASVGGPIAKDRAFFFADWESRRDSSEATVSRIVPSEEIKQGLMRYRCDPADSLCPASGIFTVTPAQFQALDPAGIGVNPTMLTYLSQFPVGNDPSQGLDTGLNFTGFRFNAPIETTNNIFTARFDFNLDREGKHTVYVRGSLADIKTDILPAWFPDRPASAVLLNNGKGIVTNYTGQFRTNLINTFRWGFTRGGIEQTGTGGTDFTVRDLDTNTNFNRAFGSKRPIHEFKDDLAWIRGSHTIQGGASYRRIRNDRFTQQISFSRFVVNNGFCLDLCRTAFDTLVADATFPAPTTSANLFTRSYMMLTGSMTQIEATFLVDPQSQTFLPEGSVQAREFGENQFEWYLQDTWRIRPDLTFIFGLRHSYFGPVWETSGAMVRPTVDFQQWWNDRVFNFQRGLPADANPALAWELAGKANGSTAWWEPDKNNFAPRVSLAWSPGFDSGVLGTLFGGPGRSSIRAGAGIYYARVGGAIAVSTDVFGSPGLSNALFNAASDFSLASAPRFGGACAVSGCSGLPPVTISPSLVPPTSATFPFTPTVGAPPPGIGFMVDNNLKTPYSMNFSLFVQRELAQGLVVDVGYVGVLGRQLLSNIDMAMIGGILTDPASGQTLWDAYNQVVNALGDLRVDNFNPPDVSTINFTSPFVANMMPNLPAVLADSECFPDIDPTSACNAPLLALTPTQAFYQFAADFWPTWVDPLFFVFDDPSFLNPWAPGLDPQGDKAVLVQPQFQVLQGYVNWGSSNYHSLQVSARRNVGRVQFGANYVLSKSIDTSSAPENAVNFGEDEIASGFIQNAFCSKCDRALSDFDLRHNFNANWVVGLPIGSGQALGSGATGALEHLIGNWEVSGAWRWRSGFPISSFPDFAFPTSFFNSAPTQGIAPISTNITRSDPNGEPNIFSDPAAAIQDFTFTPPGGVGSRNVITGPAFFQVDLGVSKTFRIGEQVRVQFRWEAFNLFNTVNFNDGEGIDGVPNINTEIEFVDNFGRIFATNASREMQFSLRISF
jgi:hypothetical protein